jgi:preprotein translocase subunit YajC
LIFIVLLFVVGYMFLIRPQRQRRQRQLQVSRQIEVGDKVLLSSGIIGRVDGFVGDHVRIEVAPGVIIEVVRGAVSRRVDEAVDGGHDPGYGQSSDRPLR